MDRGLGGIMKFLAHIWKYLVKSGNSQPEGFLKNKIDTCDCSTGAALVSTCCCSKPYGNIHEFQEEHFGLCGCCKEHTDFEEEVCCG